LEDLSNAIPESQVFAARIPMVWGQGQKLGSNLKAILLRKKSYGNNRP
jgi:hypothetical protein